MAKKTSTKTATATATVAPPAPKLTEEEKKAPSTVEQPVAVTWATCENMRIANEGTMPARRAMMDAAREAGVNYSTARTQVQRYRKWHVEGRDPNGLPNNVIFPDA